MIAALALIWLLPASAASLFAHSTLYRQVRALVRAAEAASAEKSGVARLLSEQRPTDIVFAFLLGSAALMLTWMLAAPPLTTMFADRAVRVKVSEGLAAMRPLQEQVEATWQQFRVLPYALDAAAGLVKRSGSVIDGVNFNPINGRFRLALGSTIAELADKTIILAPAVDPWQRLLWVCVPVGISPKHLPLECRAR